MLKHQVESSCIPPGTIEEGEEEAMEQAMAETLEDGWDGWLDGAIKIGSDEVYQ